MCYRMEKIVEVKITDEEFNELKDTNIDNTDELKRFLSIKNKPKGKKILFVYRHAFLGENFYYMFINHISEVNNA